MLHAVISLSRSFWFGAKLMRKPSPSFLLRVEGDAASVTAEIGRLGRADLRWSPRKHGPSQVKCSSGTGSPCGGATSRLHVTPRSLRRARLVRANRLWAHAIVAKVNMRWAADACTRACQQARAAESCEESPAKSAPSFPDSRSLPGAFACSGQGC